MDLTIKRLTPALAEDFFAFFDFRAFSDGSTFYPCYCNAFQLTEEQIRTDFFARAEALSGGPEGLRNGVESLRLAMRESAERMIAQGILQGYLAYDGALSVGWCNANDRKSYVRVGDFDLDKLPAVGECAAFADETERVKSVVCFEIAPGYRGKGIASALLRQVCEDAWAEGYDAVEGYPMLHDGYDPQDYTGPLRLYENAGFVRVGRRGRLLILRKNLT